MKKKITLISAVLLGLVSASSGQGLLSIGQFGGVDDFESRLPFTTTIGVDVGWDSNPNNAPDGRFKNDSAYIRGGIDAQYGNGSRTTNVTLNAGFSSLYYLDRPLGQDEDVQYTGRLGLNVHHRVNRQLTVGNNFYLSYEVSSDNAIGASSVRRSDQYLYGYNSAWASYAWSRRVSTVGRYTITSIDYEDDDLEDRLTQTVTAELRYVLNRLTTLVGEYRYAWSDFDVALRDSNSNFLLVGADHVLSSDLRATWRVGAENRNLDRGESSWRPYVETSLRYALASNTRLVWFNRYGYSDADLRGFSDSQVYRSSLSIRHQITKRLRTNAGVSYTHSRFGDNLVTGGDSTENGASLSLGVGYRIWTNWDLNASYRFTYLSSDRRSREFDRHRVSAGMSVTF